MSSALTAGSGIPWKPASVGDPGLDSGKFASLPYAVVGEVIGALISQTPLRRAPLARTIP